MRKVAVVVSVELSLMSYPRLAIKASKTTPLSPGNKSTAAR